MNIIADIAEDCKRNPTANSTSIPKSTLSNQSVVENGRNEEKKPVREWDAFSRRFACELNARQPDIVAALLFNHVSYRLDNPPQYCRRDGKMWYFRSAEELVQNEFPYLTEDEVYGAFDRLEKSGKIEIAPAGKYGPTNWYSMSPKIRKAHNETEVIWFRQDDALQYGIRKALLLANLHWQFNHWKRFKQDDAGNKYGVLQPGALSKRDDSQPISALPMSRDTISNLLQQLCSEDQALVRHPSLKHYYTFASKFVRKTPCDTCKTTQRTSEVHDSTAEDSDPTAEVHDPTCSKNEHNTLCLNNLCSNTQGVYCNIYRKVYCKGNSMSPPAPALPVQEDSPECNFSSNATKLMELIHQDMKKAVPANSDKSRKVTPDHLPYDDISGTRHELPYDLIIPRTIEITNAIKWIKHYWRTFKVRYTAQDVSMVYQLFVTNPSLRLEDWQHIEYEIGKSQLDRNWLAQVSDNVMARVRTAKDRLHYLPQIISQMHVTRNYDDLFKGGELVISGAVAEPYASLDFSAIENLAEGDLWRMVQPPLQFVKQENNPVQGA